MDTSRFDEQEQLVWDAQVAVAVLGKGTNILLVDMDELMTEEARSFARIGGYEFAGVLGYHWDGRVESRCEANPEAIQLCLHAAFGFAEFVAKKIKKGDSLEFLERLWKL